MLIVLNLLAHFPRAPHVPNCQERRQGHATQMMDPAVLSHFAHGGINPWEARSPLAKRLAHFFGLITLTPVYLATYSIAFDAREIVHLC